MAIISISSSASRIFLALQSLAHRAGGTSTLEADYNEICAAAVRARASVASGLRELSAAGWITQHKQYGHKCQYDLHPPAYVSQDGQNTCSSSSVVQKFSSSEVRTTGDDFHMPNLSAAAFFAAAEPADSEKDFQRIRALLWEFNIGEPTRTDLARVLVPLAQKEDEIRKICAVTREEWTRGNVRNPAGLAVIRLRDYAAGIQLPLLMDIPAQPATTVKAVSRPRQADRQRKQGVQRRPQVPDSTEEQREAAREEARKRIAERAERRAREATHHDGKK